ncbi:MAG: tRNA 2-thiouridine(34) synthase MnmA [Synechococcales cyanobacterium CRU_2_2]|nr:tRNA 2-thiouridine(34) synthase MnmA [Synechococcales cyanobacterium CRU_2_2]
MAPDITAQQVAHPIAPSAAQKVVVGLSGGVDSSAAIALLHDQGYAVEGLTLWLMKGKGQCCSEGMVDAAQICEGMGVAHHIVDIRDNFQVNIIDYLVDGYAAGITPLPCSNCNRAVKFGPMWAYARDQLQADYIATGHYARTRWDAATGRTQLLRAVYRPKDQSYFLYDLPQDELAHVLFPLGEYAKAQTRQAAADHGLHTAEKPESQDLCLVEANGSMRAFLDKYLAPKAGEIIHASGEVLGQHDGIHHYTIGQRKGLGVAYKEPLYVVALDPVMNRVVVGSRDATFASELTAQRVNWVSIAEPTQPMRAEVQIRYRSAPEPATVTPLGNQRVQVVFDQPQSSITPGQAAVWYDGELLLGGGVIERCD